MITSYITLTKMLQDTEEQFLNRVMLRILFGGLEVLVIEKLLHIGDTATFIAMLKYQKCHWKKLSINLVNIVKENVLNTLLVKNLCADLMLSMKHCFFTLRLTDSTKETYQHSCIN